MCYLIGCVSLNNENFIIKQFFADNPSDCDDEKKMLTEFMHFASGFKYIVHFNGDVFDIPYLKERMLTDCQNINFRKASTFSKNQNL